MIEVAGRGRMIASHSASRLSQEAGRFHCQAGRWEVEPVPLTLIDKDCYNYCFITFSTVEINNLMELKLNCKAYSWRNKMFWKVSKSEMVRVVFSLLRLYDLM